MANSQACELFIEQEIKEGLKGGKSAGKIGQELSEWIAKIFQVHIPARTLEQRTRRLNKKDNITPATRKKRKATNVAKDSNRPRSSRGGARPGAGRPVDENLALAKIYMADFEKSISKITAVIEKLWGLDQELWARHENEIVLVLKKVYESAVEKQEFYKAQQKQQAPAKTWIPPASAAKIGTTGQQHKLIHRLFSEDEKVKITKKYFACEKSYIKNILAELQKLEMVDTTAAKLVAKIKLA